MAANGIVKLNVGGTKFETTEQTLRKYPNSMLGRMFGSDIPPRLDSEGYTFLDANGDMFHHILNFLRNDTFDLPDDFTNINTLKSTINYFSLPEMMDRLEEWIVQASPSKAQVLEVLATKGDSIEWEHSERWVYIKREGEESFTSVLTDEQGKDSSRVVNYSDRDKLFGAYKGFCQVVSTDRFNSYANVLAILNVMGVKNIDIDCDFEKGLFDLDDEFSTHYAHYKVTLYERK